MGRPREIQRLSCTAIAAPSAVTTITVKTTQSAHESALDTTR